MRNDHANWKHRVFKILAAACVLALFSQPETWHMLFLFFDASTLDVLALLLEVQVGLVIAVFFRHRLWPVAARMCHYARVVGSRLQYLFFLVFVPGSQNVALKRGGHLGACLLLWWIARDSHAIETLREMT